MLMNRLEFVLMNNPVRAALQRRFEAPRLLRMGGPIRGGRALEIGCGRGVGVQLILDLFGAKTVDAFDLDPAMVARADARLSARRSQVHLWVGDTCAIATPDDTYDAVFDFGILHHVLDWRRALAEIKRVLKPGGRLYAEEVLGRLVTSPIIRHLLKHPQEDRFDSDSFVDALEVVGLDLIATEELWGSFAWFVASKR